MKKILGYYLSFLLAAAGLSAASNQESAYLHLYEVMDKYQSGDVLRLLESYEATPTQDDGDRAWVYDNALVILALMTRGNQTDCDRAELLADGLLYCQNNDPYFTDGRIRDGYHATELIGQNGKTWYSSPNSHTGNMGWIIIAWLRHYEIKGGLLYLEAAERLGNWIYDNCYDSRGAGGYTGGYKGWEPNQTKLLWKSTEHNIDVYVGFMKLYESTADPTWQERAVHARSFVQAMWDQTEGHFWTGTVDDGVKVNKEVQPMDVNTWGLMTFGEPGKYGAGINWVEDHCLVDSCLHGCGFKGFDFNDDKDGVWFEGTAQMCVAYQIKGEVSKSDDFLSEICRAQASAANSNRKGIVAACHDGVSTGFGESYNNMLHIGATSWYLFAERKHNPFWATSTGNPIPYTAVSIDNTKDSTLRRLPGRFSLIQNFPNPFSSSTEIRYQLPDAGRIRLVVYNAIGQRVKTLVEGTHKAGYHSTIWNGEDAFGGFVSGGIYFCKLEINNQGTVKAGRMVLAR